MTAVPAAYGSWASPLTAALVSESEVRLSGVSAVDDRVYWVESRPAEGRQVLVLQEPNGERVDITPPPFQVRSRVHEYGGGDYLVDGTTIWFSNWADQRLWRQELGGCPVPITPPPPADSCLRYADGRLSRNRRWLICVRERHEDGAVQNELVAVPADGRGDARILASGHDFFASPRPSPDGARLAWLTWDHPQMPWDGTSLWVAELTSDLALGRPRLVAGGPEESVVQPEWSPDGCLYFVSDRNGWWNLRREDGHALTNLEAEFAGPQWVMGLSHYAFLADGRLACTWSAQDVAHLGILDPASGDLHEIDLPYNWIGWLATAGTGVVLIAAGEDEPPAVVRVGLGGRVEVLSRSREFSIDHGYLARPRSLEFPTSGRQTGHALFYPPTNPAFVGLDGERPPLILMCHGGPTAATNPSLDLRTQYFTSRGFAVLHVNYGGSTGHGRAYRERLKGGWGVVDVNDCVNAARYLARSGEVDPSRIVIRGISSGGLTALRALTCSDVFAAGSIYCGVADLETFAAETHKFESHYLVGLVGPYPNARDRYRDRSPVHRAGQLQGAVIMFHGLDDPVVPPGQAEAMVAAMRRNGLPHAYLAFEGEQHGLRKAENVQRSLEAELSFYSQLFGFRAADAVASVQITNL